MTASSVEFFPCRVQLIGLPPQAVVGSNSSGGDGGVTRVPPPTATVQRVSRNLFGSPEPGAITQLLREESQRQRSYILQRYNFDIKTSMPKDTPAAAAATKTATEEDSISTQRTPLPSLIAKELQEHEQRLEQEKCNLSRTQSSAETTPPQIKRTASSLPIAINSASWHIKHNNNKASDATGSSPMGNSSSSERVKPYARQTLLTDCFNLRKSTQFNGKPAIIAPTRSPQRRLEVLQLPKPLRVASDSSSITSSTATISETVESTTISPTETPLTSGSAQPRAS